MKLLTLYKWIAGTMTNFANPFRENEILFNQAKGFWSRLENVSFPMVLIFISLGILFAIYYYKPYNEQPGRHYTPRHWLIWLFITAIITFLVTLGVEYFAVAPKLSGALTVEIKIAIGNALYASLIYFITSVVWCNVLPTNAYRLFKF